MKNDIHEAVLAMKNPTLENLEEFLKAAIKAQTMDTMDTIARITTTKINTLVRKQITDTISKQTLAMIGIDNRWSRVEVVRDSVLAIAISRHIEPLLDAVLGKFKKRIEAKLNDPDIMLGIEKAYMQEFNRRLDDLVRAASRKEAVERLLEVLKSVGSPESVIEAVMKESSRY